MPARLRATFTLLATFKDNAALTTLVRALEIPDPLVQKLAAQALVSRPSTRGRAELIRAMHQLPFDITPDVAASRREFAPALLQSLQFGDDQSRLNALSLVRALEDFTALPASLQLMSSETPDVRERAIEVVRDLVDRLYEHRQVATSSAVPDRDVGSTTQHLSAALSALSNEVERIEQLPSPDLVVESILILGSSQNPLVQRLLGHSKPIVRELAADILAVSQHPGVIELLVSELSRKQPHYRVLTSLSERRDPGFIIQMLRLLPRRLSTNHQRNLRQLDWIAWLDISSMPLEEMPDELHPRLVEFIVATGLDVTQKTSLLQEILRRGSLEGRVAAAEEVSRLDPQQLRDVVVESLEAEDVETQAWATSQLRSLHVPDAMRLLVERLESPETPIREAARRQLQGFTLETAMDLLARTDDTTSAHLGHLLRKIHPSILTELGQQLTDSVQRRRLKAAVAARRLNLHVHLLPELVSLLRDEDSVVRQTAVEVLATLSSLEARDAIYGMLNDPSERVRRAAEAAVSVSV